MSKCWMESRFRTSIISGTATSNQGPLQRMQVTLAGTDTGFTKTSASGHYSFTRLWAGPYTVTIDPPEEVECTITSQNLVLGIGEAETVNFVCEWVCDPLCELEGIYVVQSFKYTAVANPDLTVDLAQLGIGLTALTINADATFTGSAVAEVEGQLATIEANGTFTRVTDNTLRKLCTSSHGAPY